MPDSSFFLPSLRLFHSRRSLMFILLGGSGVRAPKTLTSLRSSMVFAIREVVRGILIYASDKAPSQLTVFEKFLINLFRESVGMDQDMRAKSKIEEFAVFAEGKNAPDIQKVERVRFFCLVSTL